MPDHRFGCTHGNPWGAFTKTVLYSTGLDAVVEVGRSAVKVHIVDVRCGQARIRDSRLHSARGFSTGIVEPHSMIGIARGAITEDLGVNRGAAGSRRLFRFDHVYPGAFAEHESISTPRERARPSLRIQIPGFR